MSMPVFIAIILMVTAFGIGMAVAGRIDRHDVSGLLRKLDVATDDLHDLKTELRHYKATVADLGPRIQSAESLVAELADGIEHACEFFADGDVDQAKYVVFGLDDRLKTRKRQ